MCYYVWMRIEKQRKKTKSSCDIYNRQVAIYPRRSQSIDQWRTSSRWETRRRPTETRRRSARPAAAFPSRQRPGSPAAPAGTAGSSSRRAPRTGATETRQTPAAPTSWMRSTAGNASARTTRPLSTAPIGGRPGTSAKGVAPGTPRGGKRNGRRAERGRSRGERKRRSRMRA